MITIDGSHNEGGGQILRTALTLSLATRTPFRIEKIRAGRKQPGLLRQHIAAVKAAAQIGKAEVQGDQINSQELTFAPKDVIPGEYNLSIGTAGSTSLVLQTVLPVLMLASKPRGRNSQSRCSALRFSGEGLCTAAQSNRRPGTDGTSHARILSCRRGRDESDGSASV